MKEVAVAFSGGIDSTMAAFLLKKQFPNLKLIFMNNWDPFLNIDLRKNEKLSCSSQDDYIQAVQTAKQLSLFLKKTTFVREYWEYVFRPSLQEWKKGLTPNPDILCNQKIKFYVFRNFAFQKLKVDFIATGHYARIRKWINGYFLVKAKDLSKDQSYFLARLKQKYLKKIIFPIGEYQKKQLRRVAKNLKLLNASRPDSTGLCFVGERNFASFLKRYLPLKKGLIINDDDQNIIGIHDGLYFYTIGQRKHLFVDHKLVKAKPPLPLYVLEKDISKNFLYVTSNKEKLMANKCFLKKVRLFIKTKLFQVEQKRKFFCKVQFCYLQKNVSAKVKLIFNKKETTAKLLLLEKVFALTPGQYAVFFQEDVCLGSGIIESWW